ncbi:ABC transporter ATP-binding protein [Williamsia sp. 1138]|uniref:ABC transporter ATP-binding protein n=1 Tax=Williamsia sp. 1138 TaxID=1903117 RepID=UPI000A0F99D4|nr:ABC transporter ATP-binding protein [Williamsia sp. 1138]OZG29552.1 ABC transporter ATP-binding protein [Williamsia sp. 1138]
MSMDIPVVITDLAKNFGTTRALDGLSMSVTAGSVHGFLGPNGSGKSTTLRILLGLAKADAGSVEVFGYDPWRHADIVNPRLAYVPGDVSLWPSLTGGEVLTMLASSHGRPNTPRRTELIDRFELDTTKKTKSYSKGNRQKVALIAALESDAELLILDEPTTGLDPLMEAAFRECISERRRVGVTVLLSSHMLAEVEALCDSVTIIRGGRSVESGTLQHFRKLTRLQVRAEAVGSGNTLLAHRGVYDVTVSADHLTCTVDRDALNDLLTTLGTIGVTDLSVTPITLEDLFLRQYLQPPDATAAAAP